ncbi:hypothetical protein ACLESO_13225 [Pyxidicoccus sp. 3LG]
MQVRLDNLRALATSTALARERLAARPRVAEASGLETLLGDLRRRG